MKQTIFIFLLVISISYVEAQQKNGGTITITGKISGDTKGYNKIYSQSSGSGRRDSVELKDGGFTITMPYTKPEFESFYTEYEMKTKNMYSIFSVLIDRPGIIHLTDIDITKGLNGATVKGIRSAEEYQLFSLQQQNAYKKIAASLNKLYGKEWVDEKDPVYPQMELSRDSLTQLYLVPLIQNFVKKHPDSYASVNVLNNFREIMNLSQMETVYSKLSKRMKNTEEGKNFADYMQGIKNSAIGSYVNNFTLNDPNDKPFSFGELKGKYVLVDFWASWCYPCKMSFPHMKEVYKKYKGDKFEIYSISIDKDKAAWLKAVKEQNLPWLQSLDTKNISQSGFAVTGVPATYLIDPEGEIIAKEVGFDPDGKSEIEKKLEEVLPSSKKL